MPSLITTNTKMEAVMNRQFLYNELFLLSLPANVKPMMDDDDGSDSNDDGNDDDSNGTSDVDDKDQGPNKLSLFGKNILFDTQM